MILAIDTARLAFSRYLRTGQRLRIDADDALQLKFNPYHDPENGQFTFGPGGLVLRSGAAPSVRGGGGRPAADVASPQDAVTDRHGRSALLSDGVYRPDAMPVRAEPVAVPPRGPLRPPSNYEAMYDPRTIQEAFPRLRDTPAGAIVALADNLFDFTGPANELTASLDEAYKRTLIADIKAIDPGYHYDSFGEPLTAQGRANEQNDLRFVRAAKYASLRSDLEPLQLETLRFMQMQADKAYDAGMQRLSAGKMNIRLSAREALGNFIDRNVREGLRERYGRERIDFAGSGPIRVNRREMNSDDGTYRQPDARVGRIAFDVTLSPKTHGTSQVRGFFNADFRPSEVIIIRPKQVGPQNTYVLRRERK